MRGHLEIFMIVSKFMCPVYCCDICASWGVEKHKNEPCGNLLCERSILYEHSPSFYEQNEPSSVFVR
jgi:hypothetical protein